MAQRYFRYRWEEDRGDEHSDWGAATYLFATDESGLVEQQFEIYDDGHVLAYDQEHLGDAYGMLPDQRADLASLGHLEITADEFSEAIVSLKLTNR